MSDKVTSAAPAERPAPPLTIEQIEAAVLHLLGGHWNTWAGILARPEKLAALRKRAARAVKAEEVRIVEAPTNIALERTRRGA